MCETTPAWVALAQGGMFIIGSICIAVGLYLTVRRIERLSKIIVAMDETVQEVDEWLERL